MDDYPQMIEFTEYQQTETWLKPYGAQYGIACSL